MRKQKEEDYQSGALTAMIDIVFQLIIFFVVTSNMQNKDLDERIHLAVAPHVKPIKGKDPREIKVDVNKNGQISIARSTISPAVLRSIVLKAVKEYGQDTPIIIRADGDTKHSAVESTLNACTEAGVYKIKFGALKERAGEKKHGKKPQTKPSGGG